MVTASRRAQTWSRNITPRNSRVRANIAKCFPKSGQFRSLWSHPCRPNRGRSRSLAVENWRSASRRRVSFTRIFMVQENSRATSTRRSYPPENWIPFPKNKATGGFYGGWILLLFIIFSSLLISVLTTERPLLNYQLLINVFFAV